MKAILFCEARSFSFKFIYNEVREEKKRKKYVLDRKHRELQSRNKQAEKETRE